MDVSVVIPAYNEANRIEGTLERVIDFFEGSAWSCEVIVIDDGSHDNTARVVGNWRQSRGGQEAKAQVSVITLPHQGKGAAVTEGVMAARGKWILMTDADLSTPINEWGKIFEALKNGAIVAAGSRQAQGAKVEKYQPVLRQVVGVLFGFLARLLFPVGVIDTQCGFKGFEAVAAKELFKDLRVSGFCFDLEVLLRARARGFSVVEIPVVWRNDPDSRVKLWRDWPQVLKELWLIRQEVEEQKRKGDPKR